MASYHLRAKIGAKGKAAARYAYISRQGKYSNGARYEDLAAVGHGHMPKWAEQNPAHFWNAADEHERANGSAFREFVVALPRELSLAQNKVLVENFIAQQLGDQHAYQWAIHKPNAALEGGEQPHAHIMYSQRLVDGIDRDPEQYFKRYNSKNPEKGGAKKASGGQSRAQMKLELVAARKLWADLQNAHLERHGHDARVDHRTLKEQGIDRPAEKHLGGPGVRALSEQDLSALRELRAAEGDNERAKRQVSSLINDLIGELAAAKAKLHEMYVMAKKYAATAVAEFKADLAEQARIERAKEQARAFVIELATPKPEPERKKDRDGPSGPSMG